jgi:hypothetical protein
MPQDERGVSRDEMAAALLEVAEGRVPKDRLALKCLLEDMASWPFLDAEEQQQAADALSSGKIAASASSNNGVPTAIVDDGEQLNCMPIINS